MRPTIIAALAAAVLLAVLVGVLLTRRGAAPTPPPPPVTIAPPPSPGVGATPPAAGDEPVDQVRKALDAALSAAAAKPASSPFPEGTRLVAVSVHDDLATVALSSEFRNVANQGNTAESAAQQALRAAVAQCPKVARMKVLVEGKPFEGEHSGPWDDVPVRDEPGSNP